MVTAIKELTQNFDGKPNRLTRELEAFRERLALNPEALDATALRERNRQQALTSLDRKISALEREKDQCQQRENHAEQARQAAAVLPSVEVLEKIQRYETKLERQMFRAMAQLERLQRIRRGENVPAPLSVAVTEGRECKTHFLPNEPILGPANLEPLYDSKSASRMIKV